MAKFTVRVQRVQFSYADLEVDEATLEAALEAIDLLPLNESDCIGLRPKDWEMESEELNIQYIEDEEGNTVMDVYELEDAARGLKD